MDGESPRHRPLENGEIFRLPRVSVALVRILVPLVLALFWSRMTGAGFVWGTLLGIAIGMQIRSVYGELVGSLAILAISAAVPLALGFRNAERYDFEKLTKVRDATDTSGPVSSALNG